jgi:hypothetical protein
MAVALDGSQNKKKKKTQHNTTQHNTTTTTTNQLRNYNYVSIVILQ